MEDTLNFMKNHFFQAWFHATNESNAIWDAKSGLFCFWRYLDHSYDHYKYAFKDWLSKIKHIKIAKSFCKKLKGCDYIITYDEYCSPCIHVMFTKRNNASIEDISKDVILYEKISETYFNDLDIDAWFRIVGDEADDEITQEDIDTDKELVSRFYEYAKDINNALKDNKDLQDELCITSVVDMKVNLGGISKDGCK